MKPNKIIISTSVLCLGLAVTVGVLAVKNRQANALVAQLEKQLKVQKESEKRAVIVKSISTQMEEIAYSQKEISDEQRIKAEHQTQIATTMRNQSEKERQNALKAEHQAMLAKQKAVDASLQAEQERRQADQQRVLAEERRLQAEYSMRVADTLSYLSLARSLGSMSVTQYRSANYDLAALLATSAYEYSSRYGGNVYQPAIYQPLSLSCKSTTTWNGHEGALARIAVAPKSEGCFATVGTYGGLYLNTLEEGKLSKITIVDNKSYDFRDACIGDDGSIYAVSRTGHLFIINNLIPSGKVSSAALMALPAAVGARRLKVIPITSTKNLQRVLLGQDALVLVSENQLVSCELKTGLVRSRQTLPFKVTAVGRNNHGILLFGDDHACYVLADFQSQSQLQSQSQSEVGSLTKRDMPINGTVTAYAYDRNQKLEAYGMKGGDIYMADAHGGIRHLVGHRSPISQMAFRNGRLYSSSLDGTVDFWNTSAQKPDPMTIVTASSWIRCFSIDLSDDYIWTGTQDGTLMQTLISAPKMYQKVKSSLKRNYTSEERKMYLNE